MHLVVSLSSFAKKKFGLNSRALEVIYKGAVIPILSYGVPIWGEAIGKKYNILIIERIQRLIALRLCHAYKTVSTDALNIICNLMPIDLRLKQIEVEYQIKKDINPELINNYLNLNLEIQRLSRPVNRYLLPHPGTVKQIQIVDNSEEHINVFTSGYKSHNSVGSGFCVMLGSNPIKKAKFKLSVYCTRFQSELHSILMALKFMKSYSNTINSFTLYGNSTAIRALMNYSSVTEQIQKILSEINNIESDGKIVRFSFNFRNYDSEGHSTAKELSKAGSVAHRSIDYDVIPFSYIRKSLQEKHMNIWNNRWNDSSKGDLTREFFPTVRHRITEKKHFVPNFELTQIISNHGKFNNYLFRFKLRNDSKCDRCGALEEDIKHIIFNCPEFDEQRTELKHKCEENGIPWPCDLQFLINYKIFAQFSYFCSSVFNK